MYTTRQSYNLPGRIVVSVECLNFTWTVLAEQGHQFSLKMQRITSSLLWSSCFQIILNSLKLSWNYINA